MSIKGNKDRKKQIIEHIGDSNLNRVILQMRLSSKWGHVWSLKYKNNYKNNYKISITTINNLNKTNLKIGEHPSNQVSK